MLIPAFAGMTLLLAFCVLLPAASAAEKTWTGSGDASDWFDDDNWTPAAAPTSADDVLINLEDASVKTSKTFEAKSLKVGGTAASTLVTDPFIFGTVAPADTAETAVTNRRQGHWTIKGSSGVVSLKGSYKDSEETLAKQPSLVFFVE